MALLCTAVGVFAFFFGDDVAVDIELLPLVARGDPAGEGPPWAREQALGGLVGVRAVFDLEVRGAISVGVLVRLCKRGLGRMKRKGEGRTRAARRG